ncbi:hypothetical protein, partial [Aeromonas dhakensis]|uniref:hypothetical protein n=2 Tax=Aeromonas dhakensis TaxID=196024 RepID=UPI0038D1F85E
ESQALVFAFLSALASRGSELIRLACSAVLVRAHYREARRDDKGFFTKKTRSLRYAAKRFYFALITTISVFHWI